MFKRLLAGALALVFAALHTPAFAAGQWPQARSQQMGADGRPAVGYRAYFFAAGTSTPLTTYTDYSLAVPNPAYVESDGTGRFPAVFFDEVDGFYRVRVTTAAGVVIYDDDAMPIVGPGEGGGGAEVPVDPNALLATGDTKTRYGTGTISGFVRLNGRTIGSATSGAAERANADTQDLYEYLWLTDATLAVSGGRGVSATADFEANKTIALPDFRGRAMVALDDMGNTAASILPGITTLGEITGDDVGTLSEAQLPAVTVSGTTSSNGTHRHRGWGGTSTSGNVVGIRGGTAQVIGASENGSGQDWADTLNGSDHQLLEDAGAHTHTWSDTFGSGATHSLVQPSIGITVYIKL